MAREGRPFDYETATIEEALDYGYGNLWATVCRDFHYLSQEERLKIVGLVTDVCHHCYSTADWCHCWNDE